MGILSNSSLLTFCAVFAQPLDALWTALNSVLVLLPGLSALPSAPFSALCTSLFG